MYREKTKVIHIGDRVIGGGNPILIQSMTNTKTNDVAATVAQIERLAKAGCDIVRCTVPDLEAAKAIAQIKNALSMNKISIPLVADIHFDYKMAVAAIEYGADKIRINPGNIGSREKVAEVVRAARERSVPIRVGVNSGSLEKELIERYHGVTAEGIVESALDKVHIIEALNYDNLVISIKSSDVMMCVKAHELLADKTQYPLHVGITEAGTVTSGNIKSAVGLKKKKMLFVAGGVGAAPVYPQVKWLHEHGIDADVILGAKTKDMVILEKELEAVAGNLYVTTDDGSYGRFGMVTTVIEDLVTKEGKHYDVCVAIGPMIMMKFVCLLTKKLELPTIVSMNPIMVDGTGMCGACRLQVGDEIKFACVDGPEFDGHLVDFDQAMKRSQMYKTEEGRAMLKLTEGDTHHGGCGNCGGDN